jgi:hypothetical protein
MKTAFKEITWDSWTLQGQIRAYLKREEICCENKEWMNWMRAGKNGGILWRHRHTVWLFRKRDVYGQLKVHWMHKADSASCSDLLGQKTRTSSNSLFSRVVPAYKSVANIHTSLLACQNIACSQTYGRKTWRKEATRYLHIDGRIILNWVLKRIRQ